MAQCSGIRADGGRCGAQAIRSSEYCVSHHPDYEETRRRRNSKGGKRGGRGRPQAELTDIKQRLSDLAEDVLADKVDKGVGAVASQILNVYLRAITVEMKVKEVEELEERIAQLEAEAGETSWVG
jgi:uncharacterized small protein (DUF1192 family)